MSTSFNQFLDTCRKRIDATLQYEVEELLSPFSRHDSRPQLQRLADAMRYSLLNGGKRIRPALVYGAAMAVDNQKTAAAALDHIAAAVEMIHAYSLIHDDLPAMDDDDLRRGQPTCHRAFDEATAILAGDALQARAFELLSELPDTAAAVCLQLVNNLAVAAGPRGMVGGQALDLQAVNQSISLQQLETIHRLKTGAIIRAATAMGGIFAGADHSQCQALDTYAEAIGLAFQVQDDILDIESTTEQLGKTQGADQALNKPTYPALMGMDAAKQLARQLHQQALDALAGFGATATPLRQLSEFIVARRH